MWHRFSCCGNFGYGITLKGSFLSPPSVIPEILSLSSFFLFLPCSSSLLFFPFLPIFFPSCGWGRGVFWGAFQSPLFWMVPPEKWDTQTPLIPPASLLNFKPAVLPENELVSSQHSEKCSYKEKDPVKALYVSITSKSDLKCVCY